MTENESRLNMILNRRQNILSLILLVSLFIFMGQAFADARTQAKRIHDRLAGVEPSIAVLNSMEALVAAGNDVDAAYLAMDNKHFYNATLVNFITPWTNEAQAVFPEDMDTEGTLNDYTATLIGVIRDDLDFRRILYDDILYIGAGSLGITGYSYSGNTHYKELEALGVNMGDPSVLVQTTQSANTGGVLMPADTAGIMTTRAAAKAFFSDGTNRAMFRFTVLNHLCEDLEQLKDVTLPADRIRQDVSRSPGGDSRIFMNACIGCHTAMDPLTQSLAYYNYDGGTLDFTNGVVQPKNLINADNFKPGFIVPDDSWVNYWRQGKNSLLGWNSTPLTGNTGEGSGAKSMGQELAYSDAFARCQVEKVFKAVCLRPAGNAADRAAVTSITSSFTGNGHKLKQVFAETAAYCKGP